MTRESPISVLLVDDEPDMRWVLANALRDAGHTPTEASNGAEALARLADAAYDVVLSDVRMPEVDGVELLRRVHADHDAPPVILLSAAEDIATAVDAMKLGAYDYFAKPFSVGRLLNAVERAAEQHRLRREVEQLRRRIPGHDEVRFGSSPAATQLVRTIDLVAEQDGLAVLLCGESGTGKEVVARAIHARSARAERPFVAIDCGALPEALIESQLFGHRKGAFTGADSDRPGLFREADGGTLFLDELGNLPLGLQAKLLRALQERAALPIGGDGEPVPFDVRLVCATNAELEQQVADGSFRVDLYHRIAEFTVRLPSLRDRPEDIAEFADRFRAEANAEMGRAVHRLAPAAVDVLARRPWPGNLRELRNTIRRGVLLATTDVLTPDDLADAVPPGEDAPELGSLASDPAHVSAGAPDHALPLDASLPADGSLTERVRRASMAIEARILASALEQAGGNKAAAARALQIDYTTLHRKLKRHGL